VLEKLPLPFGLFTNITALMLELIAIQAANGKQTTAVLAFRPHYAAIIVR